MERSQVEKREERYRFLCRIAVPVCLILAVWALLQAAARPDRYAASQAALGAALLLAPYPLSLLRRVRLPQDMRLLYTLFVTGTVVVGSALYGYSRIPYWDKIMHFISGLLLAAASLTLYHVLSRTRRPLRQEELVLALAFTFAANVAIAALWEMYEYALLVFFSVDAVNNATTGVHDTLQDMIVCTVGGILFLFSVARSVRRGKDAYLVGVYQHALRVNGYFRD